ncbi:MAG: hypothetical protein R6V41_09070 [Desulfobacteraceae bacterium]
MTDTENKTPESVLWMIDLSAPPETAFKNIEKYKEGGSEIHIFYVGADASIHPGWYGEFKSEHAQKIHEKASRTAGKQLDRICEKYLSGCPYYIRHSYAGDPVDELMNLVEKEGFDLAVFSSKSQEDTDLARLRHALENRSDVPIKIIQ